MSALRWATRRRRDNSNNNDMRPSSSSGSMPTAPPAAHTASHLSQSSQPRPRESISSLPSISSSGRGGPSSRRTSSPAIEQLRNRTAPQGSSSRNESISSSQSNSNASASESSDRQARTRERMQTSSAPAAMRSATPPPYAHHTLDRAPLANPMVLDDRPRVPPPIFLRSSSTQPQSKSGTLRIHMPGWGIALVCPPKPFDLHPLEAGSASREPPAEDTVLTGALVVNMKERRRVQAISVGVQGVARLHMGPKRQWEEDGIFERGVEVLSGDAEGIWLEKGEQSFSFSILLPATLATYDHHQFGRVSYLLTARIEGLPTTSKLGMFKSREVPVQGDVPFLADFQVVIGRSDKLSNAGGSRRGSIGSRNGGDSPVLSPLMTGMSISDTASIHSEEAIALGSDSNSTPPLRGLYHRRQSSDMNLASNAGGYSFANDTSSPPYMPPNVRRDSDTVSLASSVRSTDTMRSEKNGWLVGDISVLRKLKVHANPSGSNGVQQLDLRKEGYVEGLGPWRFLATSEALSIASVMLIQLNIPSPSPRCTIFFVRLIVSQNYELISPRTPNEPPHKPESAKNHVIYQVGRPHRHGESRLAHTIPALWRGTEAGGDEQTGPATGWRTRAIVRLPTHEKIRPSTNSGTITPIRVSHELLLRVFYSIEGEAVNGTQLSSGPGEVRMCQMRMPICIPSCLCSTATLNLPTYECAATAPESMDDIDPAKTCLCAASFAELSANCVRRPQAGDEEDEWIRDERQPGKSEASPASGASGAMGASPALSPGTSATTSPMSPLSPLSPGVTLGGGGEGLPNGGVGSAPRLATRRPSTSRPQ